MKSCSNCRHLSRAETVTFGEKISEVRVLCMMKLWKRGSVDAESIYRNPGRFEDKADACALYQIEAQYNPSALQTP